MNVEVIMMVASAISYGSYAGYNIYKIHKKRKNKNKTFCFIASRHAGLTTCIKTLRDENREYSGVILIDEDDVLEKISPKKQEHLSKLRDENQDLYQLEIYELMKEHISQMRSVYGEKPIIVFSSLVHLPKYLEVKPKRCIVMYSSSEFHSELSSAFEPEQVKRMRDSRDMLLSLPYQSIKYRNFGEMKRILEQILFQRPTV